MVSGKHIGKENIVVVHEEISSLYESECEYYLEKGYTLTSTSCGCNQVNEPWTWFYMAIFVKDGVNVNA